MAAFKVEVIFSMSEKLVIKEPHVYQYNTYQYNYINN